MSNQARIRKPIPQLYFDPVDEPAPGKAVLITSRFDPVMRKRGASVERCLLNYLGDESPEDVLFRRVDENVNRLGMGTLDQRANGTLFGARR